MVFETEFLGVKQTSDRSEVAHVLPLSLWFWHMLLLKVAKSAATAFFRPGKNVVGDKTVGQGVDRKEGPPRANAELPSALCPGNIMLASFPFVDLVPP